MFQETALRLLRIERERCGYATNLTPLSSEKMLKNFTQHNNNNNSSAFSMESLLASRGVQKSPQPTLHQSTQHSNAQDDLDKIDEDGNDAHDERDDLVDDQQDSNLAKDEVVLARFDDCIMRSRICTNCGRLDCGSLHCRLNRQFQHGLGLQPEDRVGKDGGSPGVGGGGGGGLNLTTTTTTTTPERTSKPPVLKFSVNAILAGNCNRSSGEQDAHAQQRSGGLHNGSTGE